MPTAGLEEICNVHRNNHSDILVIALLGGFSGIGGGPFYGTGYYGGGGLGLIVVILLILLLMGNSRLRQAISQTSSSRSMRVIQ